MALKLDRAAYVAHKWLGLATGFVLVLIGLTGSFVAFGAELDALQFPHLLRVAPGGKRLGLEPLFDAARGARPGSFVYGCGLDDDPSRSVELYFEEDGHYGAVFADPYTGQVLGVVDQGDAVSRVLLELHYTLLLRPWGDVVVALVGFAFIGSGMTGLWVYRRVLLVPFRRGLGPSLGARELSKRLHTLVGVAALAFNLVLAVSGVYMMLYAFSPTYLSGADERAERARPKAPPGVSPDLLLANALLALPGFQVRGLYLPEFAGDPAHVYGNLPGTPVWLGGRSYGRSFVELDALSGRVLQAVNINTADPLTRYEAVLYELHFGQFGGWPVKTLYALIGLTPGLLSITGFVLWWKRRRVAVRRSAPARRLLPA